MLNFYNIWFVLYIVSNSENVYKSKKCCPFAGRFWVSKTRSEASFLIILFVFLIISKFENAENSQNTLSCSREVLGEKDAF